MGKNSRNVIIDNGAGRIKYGPASEQDMASAGSSSGAIDGSIHGMNSVPNCVARMNKQMQVLVGDEVDDVANGSLLSYTRPFERGYVTNMHCQIEIWSRLFNKILKLGKVDDTNLIITEAPFLPDSIQNDFNEVIFEDFGFDSCLRRPAAWFSAYEFAQTQPFGSSTRSGTNCCIVDSGFSFTHILPFVNGKCIKKAAKRVNIGGKLLTNYLKEIVSYRQWNMMDEYKLMDQIKESLCYISADFQVELAAVHLAAQKPMKGMPKPAPARDYLGEQMKKGFVLPDFQSVMRGYVRPDHVASDPNHQELSMETERFCVPEVLFYPSDVGMNQGGIVDATAECLSSMDDVDAGLAAANLVLTGGNTKFPQFEQRFYNEVRPIIPDMFESRTYLPENPDYYAWNGASRFVNDSIALGTLGSSLASRKEYLEKGSAYINEKFWRGW
jgi:actin-related protein 6